MLRQFALCIRAAVCFMWSLDDEPETFYELQGEDPRDGPLLHVYLHSWFIKHATLGAAQVNRPFAVKQERQ